MSRKTNRLTITKGSDRAPVIRILNQMTGDPMDLSAVTLIQVELKKQNRQTLVLDNMTKPSTKAQESWGGMLFTAENAGAIGNTIKLNFNGVDTILEVITDWNNSNPTNPVSHNAPDENYVLPIGSIQLTDGYNEYTPVEVWGDPRLGKIKVTLTEKDTNSLQSGSGQTIRFKIDHGENPGGTRVVGHYENMLDVLGN